MNIRKIIFLASLFVMLGISAQAESSVKLVVLDSASGEPLLGAVAAMKGNAAIGGVSNLSGVVTLNDVPNGTDSISVHTTGYKAKTVGITVPANGAITILMPADDNALEDVIVVASTRSNDRIENATMKVEVLGPEEMSEESMIKPGNIASLLGDISGVQIQQSSAVSGNSNVRIQGLSGKYTQMLRDGMPLYNGFSGGFGVLSIAPLDLQQLELIKGSASTLYGGGAIGGLVNFISKTPKYDPDAAFVLNGSTLKEGNVNAYYSQRWKHIGLTLFAGQTLQKEVDVDGDGLSDVSRLSSTQLHPTLYIYPDERSSIAISWYGSYDDRTGGDMLAIGNNGADAAHPYFEENKLNRNTFSLISERRFNEKLTLHLKGSLSDFDRNVLTNTYDFKGNQKSYYAEASFLTRVQRHTLTGGFNVTGDHFAPSASTPAMVGAITNTAPGVFLQDNWIATATTKIEGGIRVDHHNSYGYFVLPRLAVFQRINTHWGLRGGYGMGYKSPNPLTPQIRDYDIVHIHPIAANTVAEQSYGVNLEVNYRYAWDDEHTLFVNSAFFRTQINHPYVGMEAADGSLYFVNEDQPIVTGGLDNYIQMKLEDWEIYLGYTYTDAKRKYLSGNPFVELTPRHRAAGTLVYEIEGSWRFGVEASYNGMQNRDGDSNTPDYVFLAAMVERKFGPKMSLVLNGENLLDARQTRYEKIFTGTIADPTYKPLWAPIDGIVINMAFRFNPFAK